MSEYPSEWSVRSLGEIAERVRRTSTDQDLDVLTISSTEGWVDQKRKWARDMAGKSIERYTLLQQGEFSYNRGNSKTYPQGCVFRLDSWDRALVPNVYHSFSITSPDIDDTYLKHFFSAGGLNDQLRSVITSSVRDNGLLNITADTFFASEIPVPPLPEQKKIAEILSGIDNVISKKIIRNEKQKTTASLILDSALSNAEYRQAPLSEIAHLERGKFSHRPRNDPAYYGGDHPFIQTGDIPKSGIRICEHKQTLNEKGLQVSRQFPKGTIVITIAATIGEVGILSYPACFPDSLVGITPKTEECDPVFLLFSLRRLKDKLLQMAPQSAQSNLNLEILGKLLLPLPPLNEQRQIARMICCEDSRASAESIGISKLQHLKKAVASNLLTGRKRVSV